MFEPITLEKNGHRRVAQSPSTLVRLQWNGWRPVGSEEKANVVELTRPLNPAEHNADAVVKHLEQADDAEKARVAELEQSGAARKSVLRAAGVE